MKLFTGDLNILFLEMIIYMDVRRNKLSSI